MNHECIVMEPFVYQKLLSINFIFMQDFFLVSSQSFHQNLHDRQFICTALYNLQKKVLFEVQIGFILKMICCQSNMIILTILRLTSIQSLMYAKDNFFNMQNIIAYHQLYRIRI